MPGYPWKRAIILMLLGMGVFFTIATLLALLVWLAVGEWRPYLEGIALLSIFLAIPVAYQLWGRYVDRYL